MIQYIRNNIKNKKGSELTLQTIVILVILVIAMIIIIYFFMHHYGGNATAFNNISDSVITDTMNQ